MKSYWVRAGPTCNDQDSYKKRRGYTETQRDTQMHREEGPVKVEAEIGMMQLQPRNTKDS
jgi:hypothetical protein